MFGSLTDGLGLTKHGEQEAATRRAAGRFTSLELPTLGELDLKQIGQLTPEQMQAYLSEGSALQNIYVDPRLKEAQQKALDQLQEIADAGGLTAQDKALLSQIAREERTQERGQREAIIQSAKERGISGSGLELGSQMIAQQNAATRQSIRDQEAAAMAEGRKMEALLQSGQLGGQMRSQEFGEQAKIAEAQDAMERFNLANKQNVEASNVGARNQAQQYNLSSAQDLANQRAMYRANIPQMQFQNQLGLAQGQSQADLGMAQMYGQQSQSNMQALGSGALAYATFAAPAALASDKEEKKDISMADNEIDSFLSELTGYKYSYKRPERHGEGERLGVMAQDMEKSKVGKEAVFKDQDNVKNIDSSKAISAILASLGRLNEKVEDIKYGKK
jgi:hypothetical protein